MIDKPINEGVTGCPPDEQIMALVEGALASEERSRVESHLDECAPCRDRRDDAENLVRVSAMMGKSKLHPRDFERIDRVLQNTIDEVRKTAKKKE